MRNNINIAGLSEYVNEVKKEELQSKIQYGVDINWISGMKTEATVQNIKLGNQRLVRDFKFSMDEPNQLLGLNSNPTPQEYLMAGVAGCMAVTFVAGATLLGISLDSLELRFRGTIDLKGFLGIESQEPTGFNQFDCEFIVSGDGSLDQYEILRHRVMKHSPNYTSMINGVSIVSKLVMD